MAGRYCHVRLTVGSHLINRGRWGTATNFKIHIDNPTRVGGKATGIESFKPNPIQIMAV